MCSRSAAGGVASQLVVGSALQLCCMVPPNCSLFLPMVCLWEQWGKLHFTDVQTSNLLGLESGLKQVCAPDLCP
jgi:hypothetical protein